MDSNALVRLTPKTLNCALMPSMPLLFFANTPGNAAAMPTQRCAPIPDACKPKRDNHNPLSFRTKNPCVIRKRPTTTFSPFSARAIRKARKMPWSPEINGLKCRPHAVHWHMHQQSAKRKLRIDAAHRRPLPFSLAILTTLESLPSQLRTDSADDHNSPPQLYLPEND